MAYYDYYQNSLPGWGTEGYQTSGIMPPRPSYQPQPNWTGADYYSAHADSLRDSSVFNYVWSKVRDLFTGGVSRSHARHWWKRVYGGLVDPSQLLPRELGAAAGYEAFRMWEAHNGIYALPLSEDRERQREALIGIAAAEATRLWAYTTRPYDKYGRMEASEVAAGTVSRIFLKTYNNNLDSYEPYSNSRVRRRSFGSRYGEPYGASEEDLYDDPLDESYASDTLADEPDIIGPGSGYYPRRNHRLGLGRRRSSFRRSPSPVGRNGTVYAGRSVSPAMGDYLTAPRGVSPVPRPRSVSAIRSPILDGGFNQRTLRTPLPGGHRSLTPLPYGGRSPSPYMGAGMAMGGGMGAGPMPPYAGGMGMGGGLGGGLSPYAGSAVGSLGGNPETVSSLAAMGANESNIVMDPVLGPGVKGTYFPEAAARGISGGGMGMGGMGAMGGGMGAMGGGMVAMGTGYGALGGAPGYGAMGGAGYGGGLGGGIGYGSNVGYGTGMGGGAGFIPPLETDIGSQYLSTPGYGRNPMRRSRSFTGRRHSRYGY
ncbi:hypothetical protein M422DRAFT_27748 [Sphaerobolus stellatus SS14]|nr:hypothetical protein M422DRAFT_27748 [Sphaerobolus stellatus SS14]